MPLTPETLQAAVLDHASEGEFEALAAIPPERWRAALGALAGEGPLRWQVWQGPGAGGPLIALKNSMGGPLVVDAPDGETARAFAAECLGCPASDLVVALQGDLPAASLFIRLLTAAGQAVALDRTKVLTVEALGRHQPPGTPPGSAAPEEDYCALTLALCDKPVVVRGGVEEVLAAVEGGDQPIPFETWKTAGPITRERDGGPG